MYTHPHTYMVEYINAEMYILEVCPKFYVDVDM